MLRSLGCSTARSLRPHVASASLAARIRVQTARPIAASISCRFSSSSSGNGKNYSEIKQFIKHHYRHFNAASVIEAAEGWTDLLKKDGKMFLTMAGASSTAELGLSIGQLIKNDKVHGICCTGANLEEDVFNLVAHNSYQRVPNWRNLSLQDEADLLEKGFNRVTDTCIPEDEAFRKIAVHLLDLYKEFARDGRKVFPHELFYTLFERGVLDSEFQIDKEDSWLYQAWKKNLPIYVPGWEDSTCGNIIVSEKIRGSFSEFPVKSGLDYMEHLCGWYRDTAKCGGGIGFFQIGGGIAGDFPICAVPLIRQDLEDLPEYGHDIKLWAYFCQISEAATSYGGYSGAPPGEKITWGKLATDTPGFIIESDATIVFPLVAAYVMG